MALTRPIALVVRGKFHYLNYFSYMRELGLDMILYYSHKRSTTRLFGLEERAVKNFPLTEYLIQAEGRIALPAGAREALRTAYGRIWSKQILSKWQPVQLLHLLCHGHTVPIARRALSEGARVVAEVVNSHPDSLNATLSAERHRLGLKERKYVPRSAADRMAVEVGLADIILAPSRHVQRTYVERGTPADRIVVLPYAANLQRFHLRTEPRRPGVLRLICVGAVSVRKGQLILLEAIRRLGSHKVELTLVGHIEDDIKPLLKQYDGYFRHLRHVPNSSLINVLHDHDVFVLPTLEEGMAVANCEAMASGLCVLTTFASGAEEVIETGRTGILVPSGSWEALATAIDRLALDEQMVEGIGDGAAGYMQTHSNWSLYANALANIYRHTMDK